MVRVRVCIYLYRLSPRGEERRGEGSEEGEGRQGNMDATTPAAFLPFPPAFVAPFSGFFFALSVIGSDFRFVLLFGLKCLFLVRFQVRKNSRICVLGDVGFIYLLLLF